MLYDSVGKKLSMSAMFVLFAAMMAGTAMLFAAIAKRFKPYSATAAATAATVITSAATAEGDVPGDDHTQTGTSAASATDDATISLLTAHETVLDAPLSPS